MKFKGIFNSHQNQEFMSTKSVKNCLFSALLAISCFSSQITAQKLPIHLVGFHSFTIDEVNNISDNLPDYYSDSLTFHKKIVLNVEKLHIKYGYYFSKIDSLKKKDDELFIYGSSGQTAFLKDVKWNCSNVIQQKLGTEEILFSKGDVFYPEIIDQMSLTVLQNASTKGYPFVSIEPNMEFTEAGDSIFVTINFSVSDTQSVSLTGIDVDGNENIDRSVILKISGIKNPSYFSESESKNIQARLLRSGLFETVELPTFQVKSNKDYKWFVKVKEKLSNQFDGILGYIPGKTGGESGYFTGIVNVYLRNFLGNARKLNFKWLRENKESQEINFFFSEPWILNYPIEATFDFNQRNQDSTYIKRKIEYGANFKFWDEWTISTSLFTEFILGLSNQTAKFSGSEILNTDKYLFGLGILYDTRDNFINPRNGITISLTGKWGIKKIVGPDSALVYYTGKKSDPIQSSQFQMEYFKSITSRQVFEMKAKFDQIKSGSLDFPDLYFLGGIQNLRGYRENQFQGNTVALIGTEYRFLISEQSYFFGFIDCGYIQRQAFPNLKLGAFTDYLPSYGTGALLNSAIGNVKVIFAFGKGDTFSTAKVHFGLQNNF